MHINANQIPTIDTIARRLIAGKSHYEAVSARTGVPWYVIAVIHEREASGSWSANLAQGDPWNRVSIHVPKGRGPFKSWEDAAYDALVNCAPYASRNTDWSIGGTLALLEKYNGLGYYNMGKASPYIWAGTDQYSRGKYTSDGHYDPNAVDRQIGCAALLARMEALDPSIVVGRPQPIPVPEHMPPVADVAPVAPAPAQTSSKGLVARCLDCIRQVFRSFRR